MEHSKILSYQEQVLLSLSNVVSVVPKNKNGERVILIMYHGDIDNIRATVEHYALNVRVIYKCLPDNGKNKVSNGRSKKHSCYNHIFQSDLLPSNISSMPYKIESSPNNDVRYQRAIDGVSQPILPTRRGATRCHSEDAATSIIGLITAERHTLYSTLVVLFACFLYSAVFLADHASNIKFAVVALSERGTVTGAWRPFLDNTQQKVIQQVEVVFNGNKEQTTFSEIVTLLRCDPLELASDAMPLHINDVITVAYLPSDPARTARIFYPVRFFISMAVAIAAMLFSISSIIYIANYVFR